ncbi:MAG: hypothetical protein WDW38_010839 [Sanguina aurantia]
MDLHRIVCPNSGLTVRTARPQGPAGTAVTAAAPPASDSRPLGNVTSSATDADLKQQMDDLIKGFSTQSVERGYWVEDSMVEGTIPAELEGTLLRNGPGIFEIGSRSIPQPFDGDGMVCSFAFKDGKAFFRNKLVRTEGFVAEQRAQKQLYRSAFNKGKAEGVWFNSPFDLAVKNVANTNVIHWGGKTLALYERGLPHHLDDNLTTVGTDDLAGSVDGNKVSRHQVHQRNGDLPSISPHAQGLPNRYTYIVASAYEGAEVFGPSNSVWKVEMDPNLGSSLPFDRSTITQSVWTPGPGKIAQEPIFVPRSSSSGSGNAEDDGWVMTMVYDATTNRSSLAILDAQRIEEGPVCSIGLTHHIPLGLHGSFTPAYLGPSPGAVDCCFEYDTREGV